MEIINRICQSQPPPPHPFTPSAPFPITPLPSCPLLLSLRPYSLYLALQLLFLFSNFPLHVIILFSSYVSTPSSPTNYFPILVLPSSSSLPCSFCSFHSLSPPSPPPLYLLVPLFYLPFIILSTLGSCPLFLLVLLILLLFVISSSSSSYLSSSLSRPSSSSPSSPSSVMGSQGRVPKQAEEKDIPRHV